MEAVLSLSDAGKVFTADDGKEKVIFENISMDVRKGDFVCIMGPSGCGKSVLLNVLGGMDRLSFGKYSFESTDCTKKMSRQIKNNISYVFQQDYLLAWRNVYKNVRLSLEMTKHREHEKEDVMNALEIVGLEKYADCLPSELSGGMRQRTGIARALVKNADYMILDQPFGALDAMTRKMLSFKLLDIWHEEKKTRVMVTNHVDEAIRLASRVYIMSPLPGRIIQEIEIPFTYEERKRDVEDEVWLELKSRIEGFVK